MKSISFNVCCTFLIALAVAVSSGCNFSLVMDGGYMFTKQGEIAEAIEDGEFSPDINRIKVQNRHGNIKVELATGEPGWTWKKKVWSDSQEMADVLLDELQMEVETVDGTQTWTVVLPEPGADLNGVESHLTMSIPADVDVDLVNEHGDLELSNLDSVITLDNRHGETRLSELSNEVSASNHHGDFSAIGLAQATIEVRHGNSKIESATGNISVSQSHGDARVESVDGDVTFNGSHSDVAVASAKGVNIKTAHGDIKVSDVTGSAKLQTSHGKISGSCDGDVEASCQHGDVRLTTGGDAIQVNTEHGDVELSVTKEDFKSVKVKASFDDIKLYLPAGSEPSIETSASHGDVDSEFASNGTSGQTVVLKNNHGDIEVKKGSTEE